MLGRKVQKGSVAMRHNVKCTSGLIGWQGRLQENYANYEQFEAYAAIYSLHLRLGYEDSRAAWEANPVVQGSVNPSDYRKVR